MEEPHISKVSVTPTEIRFDLIGGDYADFITYAFHDFEDVITEAGEINGDRQIRVDDAYTLANIYKYPTSGIDYTKMKPATDEFRLSHIDFLIELLGEFMSDEVKSEFSRLAEENLSLRVAKGSEVKPEAVKTGDREVDGIDLK